MDKYRFGGYKKIIERGEAVVFTGPFAIIPYSRIACVYIEPYYAAGEHLFDVLVVRCRDGRVFSTERGVEFWYERILSDVPGVIDGFDKESQEKYFDENPKAKAKRNLGRVVWGLVLLIVMAGLACMGIINGEIKPMGYVLLVALFGGSVYLLWQGLK